MFAINYTGVNFIIRQVIIFKNLLGAKYLKIFLV